MRIVKKESVPAKIPNDKINSRDSRRIKVEYGKLSSTSENPTGTKRSQERKATFTPKIKS